jgi:hypothetical protein
MKNLKFNMTYVPTDIITSWKRASLSSNFCSLILDENNKKYESTISTLINELIEFSIKHGMNKSALYGLNLKKNESSVEISSKLYLISQQTNLFKCFIKKIKKIDSASDFQNILFSTEFPELGFSIYSLINSFNGNIYITEEKSKDNAFNKANITIKIDTKEIK